MFQTKNQYVYERLHDQIQRGDLLPNQHLTVAELAETFDVSASPVREALKQLEKDDLVEIKPHVGAIVKGIEPEEVREIAELRLILAPEAARRAATRIPDHEIERLEAILNELDTVIADHDYDRYQDLNHQFHHLIYSHSGNSRLEELLLELWQKAQRTKVVYSLPSHIDDGQYEHWAILEAIKQRDADKAAQQTYKHRNRISNNLNNWMKEGA